MKLLLENWRRFLKEEDRDTYDDEVVKRNKATFTSNSLAEEETSCPDSLVVFMAGGPGSGKSSVISGLGLDNFVVLNPDDNFESELASLGISANMQGMSDRRKELRTQLEVEPSPEAQAEVDKITADFSAAMKAFNSANRKHEDEVERLINSEECNSFVVDGTGATFSRMENRVERLREKGYKVAMVFVDVDPAAAEERNLARSSTGGRSLPTKVVTKTHDKVQANKAAYAKMFGDNFIFIDNSGTEEQLKGAMKSAISKLSQI